jgi:ubiquinone biosynthesis protein
MIRQSKNMLRLLRVSYVLARYDALFFLDRLGAPKAVTLATKIFSIGFHKGRQGERLRKAMQELGPTFIKLGQMLSTRPDLIGEDVVDDLAILRDKLPPFPAKQARKIIEADLGKPIDKLFDSFDDEPVAAASIAQVHFAETGGRNVAVKVLRPGIEEEFQKDIDMLLWLAGIADSNVPGAKRLKLVEVVESFAQTVRMEMDLRFEAAAASELRENFEGEEGFFVPEVFWQHTSHRVMTIQRVHGIKVTDKKGLKAAGFDKDKIIIKAGEVFFKQVFRDGFFHGDMHPGNVFIGVEGDLAVVDFGIMGRVDRKTRLYLAEMLKGFLERDYDKVAQVHFDAGYVPATEDKAQFAQACRAIAEPIFGLPQEEISIGRLLGLLFKVTREFNMETQPQLLLLQKTMLMAEGLGRILNPKVNVWNMAGPYMKSWARENLGPKARFNYAKEEAEDVVRKALRLLDASDRIAESFTSEGVRLHPETVAQFKPQRKSGMKLVAVAMLSAGVSALVTLAILGFF